MMLMLMLFHRLCKRPKVGTVCPLASFLPPSLPPPFLSLIEELSVGLFTTAEEPVERGRG